MKPFIPAPDAVLTIPTRSCPWHPSRSNHHIPHRLHPHAPLHRPRLVRQARKKNNKAKDATRASRKRYRQRSERRVQTASATDNTQSPGCKPFLLNRFTFCIVSNLRSRIPENIFFLTKKTHFITIRSILFVSSYCCSPLPESVTLLKICLHRKCVINHYSNHL